VGLNFMGCGFSFGAKDSGLNAALGNVDTQFKQLNDSLSDFQHTAAEGLAPAGGLFSGLGDELKEFEGVEWSFDDLDLSLPSDPKEQVDDLSVAMGGMAAEAAVGGTKFGRMANSVLGGAGKITGALGWVGMALGPIIAGFGQAAESAGGMVDAVTGLPRRAGDAIHRIANEGVNLTNSLEAEAVSLGQTARQVGANMGYIGSDLNRFVQQSTSMAMGLNIGADEAARAIRAWDESAEVLGATGLRSAQDVARLTSALGINADVLRNSTLELRNLGASDEQINLVTSALTQMGRETGDVAGALNELPQVLQMLERRRALGDTPEQMAAFAADTAAAARGLFALTQDSDRARQMASELAGTVTESREAFQNMFAGTEDQLPQLVTELAVTRGEVNESFRLMQAGPGGLIEGMGQLVQSTRDSGGNVGRLMEFMRGRLQQVFGPEMTATLINFWGTMDSETVQAMGSIRNASVDLTQLARDAHTTGRTMDEVLERMRAGFQTAMRRISRADSRDFLRRTRDSLRDLRVAAGEAARSTGPLRDVMGLLSRSQQLGALALMPAELRGSAIAADELRGQIMPLVEAFTSWGGILDTVLGYISIFTTDVITEWGRLSRSARQAGEEAIDPMVMLGRAIDNQAQRYASIFEEWIGDIEQWVVRAAEAFSNLNFDQLFEGPAAGEEDRGVMGAIRRVVERLGEVDWAGIWANIRQGLEGLFEHIRPWLETKMTQFREIIWNRIGEWWEGIDWNQVFSQIGDLAASLWEAVQPALEVLGTMIGQWFRDHWLDVFMVSSTALSAAIVAALVAALTVGAALLVAPFVGLWAIVAEGWERWGDNVREVVGAVAVWFQELWEPVAEEFLELWDGAFGTFESMWENATSAPQRFERWLRGLWTGFVQWFRNVFPQTTQAIEEVLPQWVARFEELRTRLAEIWGSIRENIALALSSVQEGVITPFFNNLTAAWEGISEVAGTVWSTISESIGSVWEDLVGVPERIQEGWSGLTAILSPIFESLTQAIQPVTQAFQTLGDAGRGQLDSILAAAVRLFGNSINTVVGRDMEATEEVMTSAANSVSETMQAVLHDATVNAIVSGFQEGFAAVVENMGEFSEAMVDHFTTMAEGISEIMTDLFSRVLAQSLVTMEGTETAVEGIIARLRTITAANARLAEARGAAASALARPADEEAMRRRLAQLRGNEVLQAIHHPDWYRGVGGRGGYQQLFVAKMDELREAVAALGVNPTAGTTEERRRTIREAQAAVSRIGGHPGMPGGPGR